MALRDRGVIDYYIPLFAGTAIARLNRWRLRFPGDIYAPYIPGGDGVGGGDGGYDTPDDPTINAPTITYPSLLIFEDISECGSITSDTFSSDNGQTHTASRWFIELIDLEGSTETIGDGAIVYDSYADYEHLESLPMVDLGLVPGASYRVRVRYKGSNGGWSPMSVPVVFIMMACGYTCTDYIQNFSLTFDGNVLTSYPFTVTVPAEVADWLDLKAYIRTVEFDDNGTIGGNLDSVAAGLPPGYTGPDVLVSDDGLGLTGTVNNTIVPYSSVTATIVWSGTPP